MKGFVAPKFGGFGKSIYICTRFSSESVFGPFVYRLGRKIFILERAVRFCYGLHIVLSRNRLSTFLVSPPPWHLHRKQVAQRKISGG